MQDTEYHVYDHADPPYIKEVILKNLTEDEQIERQMQFSLNVYQKAIDFDSDILKVHVISQGLFQHLYMQAVYSDIKFCFIIAAIVWLLLSLNQRSVFLSLFSIIQVSSSIPISLFIYRGILGVPYFSPLHMFVLLIVVGVGADDIFVFDD